MATIEHDGLTIESNHETEAAMRRAVMTETADGTHDSADPSANADAGDLSPSDTGGSATDSSLDRPAGDGASGDGTATNGSGKKLKPRDNPQARISQAIAKQHDAERRAADLEARLQALEAARQEPQRQAPAPEPVKPADKPRWREFEDQIGVKYSTWAEAQDAWSDATDSWRESKFKIDDIVAAKLAERDAAFERQRIGEAHQTRMAEAFEKYPDLQDHLNAADAILAQNRVQIGQTLHDAIVGSEHSGDVLQWLATHPSECLQLAREAQSLPVSAASMVRSLLELRSGAGARPGAVSRSLVSSAKPPIKPVGSSPVATPVDDSDDEPIEQYIARVNAKERKAGKL